MVSIVNAASLETRPTIKMATTITKRPTMEIRSARHFDSSSASCKAGQAFTNAMSLPAISNSGPTWGIIFSQVITSGTWAKAIVRKVRVKLPYPLSVRPATRAKSTIRDQPISEEITSATNLRTDGPGGFTS
jgi:hypothetical protein